MFTKNSLNKLKAMSNRKQTDLKNACDEALSIIEKLDGDEPKMPFKDALGLEYDVKEKGKDPIKQEWEYLVEKLIEPLRQASETRSPKIIEVALDCVSKMIEHGYINGGTVTTDIISLIKQCHESTKDDLIQLQILKIFLAAVATPGCQIHESNLMIIIHICYNILLTSSNSDNMRTAKTTLNDILKLLFSRLQDIDASTPKIAHKENDPQINHNENQIESINNKDTSAESEETEQAETIENGHKLTKDAVIAYNDCFHVFRGLCKLSMKPLGEGVIHNLHSIEVRSKILSLELLNTIFEFSLDKFKNNQRFIENVIKKHLFKSIIENGVSSITIVFRLTTSLFLYIVTYFREYMKAEIDSFFYSILLPILDRSTSTLQQKQIVLRCLNAICNIPQCVMDLFINYDCNLKGNDISETITNLVSKIAQRKISDQLSSDVYEQERNIKILALETVVGYINSLVKWCNEKYVPPCENENILLPPEIAYEEDSFEICKNDKIIMQRGKELFRISYKKGMECFIDKGLVTNDETDIARFLYKTNGLDKVMIGEYLGEPKNEGLLKTYTGLMSFKDVDIDIALREFLSRFWLPGEGQKVSRFMMSFSEMYYKENSAIFGDVDATYFLAMAIIMLATDLHNPSQKEKLTKESWSKLLVGQNKDRDYDPILIDRVFNRIAAEELKVKQDVLKSHSTYSQGMSERQRILAYAEDVKIMLERCKEDLKFKSEDKEFTTYYTSDNFYHVNLIFKITWYSLLAALSQILEESDDTSIVNRCLTGLTGGIKIACIFNLQTERETYIQALAQFTLLENIKEMKPKNVEAIKALFKVAEEESDNLQSSWKIILKCISSLDRIHEIGSGSRTDNNHHVESHKKQISFDDVNSSVVASQIKGLTFERIFANSVKLAHHAIVKFMESLCEVTKEELSTNYRTFSLQKIGEVTDYNMNRPQIVWERLWEYLSNLFSEAGLHKKNNVALLAVDLLRQLTAKRLTMPEIHDQAEILKPFEIIIHNKDKSIREYVICCISKLISIHSNEIRGGWIVILEVFRKTSTDVIENVELTFEQIDLILSTYFQLIVENNFFNDFVRCVSSYAENLNLGESIGNRAVNVLKFCADQLATGDIPMLNGIKKEDKVFTNNSEEKQLWFSILQGLVKSIEVHSLNTRIEASNILFNILNTYGKSFTDELLSDIFKEILIPQFDLILLPTTTKYIVDDTEWLITTCLKVLQSTTLFFSSYFDQVSPLLDDVLLLFKRFIVQNNESLATFGITALEILLENISDKLEDAMWESICRCIKDIQDSIIPQDFYEKFLQPRKAKKKPDTPGKETPKQPTKDPNQSPIQTPNQTPTQTPKTSRSRTVTKRVKAFYNRIKSQNLLLKVIKNLIFDPLEPNKGINRLSPNNIFMLIDSLYKTHQTILDTIENEEWEGNIEKGVYSLLLKLEMDIAYRYFEVLFYLYNDREESISLESENRINENVKVIVQSHMKYSKETSSDNINELKKSNEELLVFFLNNVLKFDSTKFNKFLKDIYPLLTSLTLSQSEKVRIVLKDILDRIGNIYININQDDK